MEFKFVKYQDDLFKAITDNQKPRVYVFDFGQNLMMAKKHHKCNFLKQESLFLTISQFKEILFPNERVLLNEEKQAILLFEILTQKEKTALGLSDFFSVFDFARDFFSFYDELNEFNIKKLEGLNGWQKERYDLLETINERYCQKLAELNYLDKTWRLNFKDFDDFLLQDYQELVFVNKLNFTNKEKDLLVKLSSLNYKIILYLQIDEKDYDQQNLAIKTISYPENLTADVNIYTTNEKLLISLNLLSLINSEDINSNNFFPSKKESFIMDADIENSDYNRLLTPDMLETDKDFLFLETKIYKFLEGLYSLLMGITTNFGKDRKIIIEIEQLIKVVTRKEIREYYNLGVKEIDYIKELTLKDIIYVDEHILVNNELLNFSYLINDLKAIIEVSTLKQFIEKIQKFNLIKLHDHKFVNDVSQYLNVLTDIYTIEDLKINIFWEHYFKNRASGFFKLLLNKLQRKMVKHIVKDKALNQNLGKESKKVAKICLGSLLTSAHNNYKNLYLINLQKGLIPAEKNRNFLLTDRQRQEYGLRDREFFKLTEKYLFLRHIFSSQKVTIIILENQEKNITKSIFIDELIFIYRIKLKELKITTDRYKEAISKVFCWSEKSSAKFLNNLNTEKDELLIDDNDFKEGFSLSYYKYISLLECPFRFYLNYIAKVEEVKQYKGKEIKPKLLGIIVHEVLTVILNNIDCNWRIDQDMIRKILVEVINENKPKISNYYQTYYEEILFPLIERSIIKFIAILARKIPEPPKKVLPEVSYRSKRELMFDLGGKVSLNGRIDLVIQTEEKDYVIDFKIGKGNLKQLDFYSLLLDFDLSWDKKIEKIFYYVLEGKYETYKMGTESQFFDEINHTLNEFFTKGKYSYLYKAATCGRCNMKDICRVV